MISAEEPSRSRLDECFLTGCYLAPCQAHTRYCGTPPTCLASASAALSHLLTALKKKDTSTCLFWMSLWPHISARPQLLDGRRGRAIRPSCAEPHLHSLDVPTRRLGKRLQRCTLWLCSRSSRPRCLPVRMTAKPAPATPEP